MDRKKFYERILKEVGGMRAYEEACFELLHTSEWLVAISQREVRVTTNDPNDNNIRSASFGSNSFEVSGRQRTLRIAGIILRTGTPEHVWSIDGKSAHSHKDGTDACKRRY